MDIQQAREQAQDENTPPDILAELAKIDDHILGQRVTANPNTPTEVLFKLGENHPRELLNNPVFNLLFLEDIERVKQIPKKTLCSLLKQKDVPQFIIDQAGNSQEKELQLLVANKLETSENVLNQLISSPHSEVVEAAQLHIKIFKDLWDIHEEKIFNYTDKKIIESSQSTTGQLSLILWADCFAVPKFILEKFTLALMLINFATLLPSTLKTLLELYSIDNFNNRLVREAIAKNPNTPTEILKELSQDRIATVRSSVAENPNTPTEILKKLSQDRFTIVRGSVAKNPNTSTEILKELCQVGRVAVENPKTPLEFLQQLAKSLVRSVGQVIKEIPQIIKYIKEGPCMAPINPDFAQIAAKRILLKKSEYDYYVKNPLHISFTGFNSREISPKILTQLAHHADFNIRSNVARNVNTPLEILFKVLVKDIEIRDCISAILSYQEIKRGNDAKDRKDKIQQILTEKCTQSLDTILQNLLPHCSNSGKEFLANHSDIPAKFLVNLAEESDSNIQKAVARHSNTPIDTLRELARRELARKRKKDVFQGLAKNPNIPDDILEQHWEQLLRPYILSDIIFPAQKFEELITQSVLKHELYLEILPVYIKKHNPNFLRNNVDVRVTVLNDCASLYEGFFPLQQPEIYPEILEQKSHAVEWITRFAVAKNPKTPKETLQELANDCNQLVRAAAKHTLSSLT